MMNTSFRHRLMVAETEEEFQSVLAVQSTKYKLEHAKIGKGDASKEASEQEISVNNILLIFAQLVE